jgi:2-polyprenyl-6-methoxyphenol hydroxylase-like FAD-dependent oxidoreductase
MDYDVIIVGARVAGSSLTVLLGRQGRRVLLVDRDRFPSDTLSTHLLLPGAVAMLDRLGALADVEAAGPRRLTRQRTYVGEVVVEGAMRAPGSYALCARRDQLDWTLIRHALAHPTVAFAERTRVQGLIWEEGRVRGVRLRDADGGRRSVRARVVVGADGKSSKMATWVQAARYHEMPPLRPVYYAYYQGLAPLHEPACEVFYQDGRIGFVLPMQPGMDCLVLELQPEDFERFRTDPAGEFEAAFRRLHGMAGRLVGARRAGPVYGTRGVENYLRVPVGPGWALTGDATYCKDPSTGTGIEDAFTQSFLLAEALGSALDGGDWEGAMAAYHHQRDEAVLSAYRATLAYTRTPNPALEAAAWLQGVVAYPGLVRMLAAGMPAVARSPEVFPAALQPSLERYARSFGPAVAAPDGQQAA